MNIDEYGYFKISTGVLSTAIDVSLLLLNAAMYAGYLSYSLTLAVLLRPPFTRKVATSLITKTIIPVFVRGFYNHVLTIVKSVLWKIAGVAVEFGKSYVMDKAISNLEKKIRSNILSVASSLMFWGGIFAHGLDLMDDRIDGYILFFEGNM